MILDRKGANKKKETFKGMRNETLVDLHNLQQCTAGTILKKKCLKISKKFKKSSKKLREKLIFQKRIGRIEFVLKPLSIHSVCLLQNNSKNLKDIKCVTLMII